VLVEKRDSTLAEGLRLVRDWRSGSAFLREAFGKRQHARRKDAQILYLPSGAKKGVGMTRIVLTLALVLSGLIGVSAQRQGVGFDLKAWNVVGNANWTVVDDGVQADKGTGFLVTPTAYGDFQMTVDVWASDDANSGVFIRCSDPKTISATNAYEVNIFDKRPDPSYRTGAIVNVAKPLAMVNAGGKWNTLEITAKGPKMTVVLNGVTTVRDAEDTKFTRGPIALQYGAGVVKFRNVRIRAL